MVTFIGGGNRGTWRKPLTCRKSLTNFLALCCTKYTSPWVGFKLTTLVVIGTNNIGSCNTNYHTSTTRRPLVYSTNTLVNKSLQCIIYYTNTLVNKSLQCIIYYTNALENKVYLYCPNTWVNEVYGVLYCTKHEWMKSTVYYIAQSMSEWSLCCILLAKAWVNEVYVVFYWPKHEWMKSTLY